MSAKLDMALGDIISAEKTKRGGFRGGRGGRGGSNIGARGGRVQRGGFRTERTEPYSIPKSRTTYAKRSGDDTWQHDRFEESGAKPRVAKLARALTSNGAGARPVQLTTGTKLNISNLEFNVSEDDLKELFGEIGDLKKVALHYDRGGRSKGTAEVVFVRRGDAQRAIQKYNDVVLDGRPMQITLAAPAHTAEVYEDEVVEEAPRRRIIVKQAPVRAAAKPQGARLAKPATRGGAGAAATKARPAKPKPATAEDLDADLDAYHNAAAGGDDTAE